MLLLYVLNLAVPGEVPPDVPPASDPGGTSGADWYEDQTDPLWESEAIRREDDELLELVAFIVPHL